MKKLKKAPSRVKYESNHPTVSARISAETKEKLLTNLAKLGMTIFDALMVLAGELDIKAIPIDEARKQGYEKGYDEATKRYMVTYLCFECGKPIAITSSETKKVVGKFLTEHAWGHTKCIERMEHT